VQIPLQRRWQPYGILAAGLLYSTFQVASINAAGVMSFVGRNDINFEFQTGGGVRYFIADNWGVRPELKVIVSNRTYTRFTIGVFYRLHDEFGFRLRRR
jgi:hypothetical protein